MARERLKNARRTNAVRFWGVSAFFLLFLLLGGLLRLPAWSGNLGLFTLYWLTTTVIFVASHRSERIALASSMTLALFDAPIVFFLQWAIGLNAHDSRVRLSVADTGPGISADILPRIFEPFFTTKAPNQNAGLGLSISYSIIQNHGGRLIAESTPGSGATFAVELPPHDGPAPAPPAVEPDGRRLRAGSVLVIEDEAQVSGMLRELLTELGLEVTVIADAETAWRMLAVDGAEFDVITVDLLLPDLSGRALFERLERELPAMAARVIFITGEIADADSEAFLERSGRPTMRKPFRVKALVPHLATLLARPASTER